MKELIARVIERVKNEPVLVLNALGAAISAAAVLGLKLDPEVEASIVMLVTAVVNLVARKKVIPVRRIVRK